MNNDTSSLIRSWFPSHGGDGEFQCGERVFPYTVIGPVDAAEGVIFTTKPRSVLAIIERSGAQDRIGVVGRYGLPDEADLDWIGKVIGRRRLLFLGDMDPVDLLVFAWVAARVGPRRVIHLVMQCTPSEIDSLGFLKTVFPGFQETVGPQCAALLECGEKLEFEAVVGSVRKAAPTWRRLLGDADSQKPRRVKRVHRRGGSATSR